MKNTALDVSLKGSDKWEAVFRADGDRRFPVNLRIVWEVMGSKQHYADWKQSRLRYISDQEVFHDSMKNPMGGRPKQETFITLDAAKSVAMLEQNERGTKLRQYFIEVENQWSSEKNPKLSRKEILLLALESEERAEKAEALIEEQKPKVEFFDTVTASDTVCDMAIACQVADLPFGRNTLLKKLREDGVLIASGSRYNTPKQRYIDQDLFSLKEGTRLDGEGKTVITFTTKVTQKGINWLIKNYKRDELILV